MLDWKQLTEKVIAEHEIRHSQLRGRKGAHFLYKPSIVKRMVDLSPVTQEDSVLEIGGGIGILSHELQSRVAQLEVIEQDPRFVSHLRGLLNDSVKVSEGDALRPHWPVVDHLISNLPYSAGSIIYAKALHSDMKSLTVMLQKEVVTRILASPGDRAYSRISILTRLHGEPRWLFDVPPDSFIPQPKVNSSVVTVVLHPPHPNHEELELLAKNLFFQKNKTLRRVIKGYLKRQSDFPVWDKIPHKELRIRQMSIDHLEEIYQFLKSEGFFPLTQASGAVNET